MNTWEIIKYILLYIVMGAGVFALVGLGIFLINMAQTISSAKKILDSNRYEIDRTLKTLPDVVENISDITYDVGQITERVKPKIGEIVDNVASVTEDVAHVSGKAKDATDQVALGVEKIADGLETFGLKTKKALDGATGFIEKAGQAIKCSYVETKRDLLGKIISVIDNLKNLF